MTEKRIPQPLITRGLIIREPWVSLIVDGKKDWEMRTTSTKVRGPIALIAGGTGKIIGIADLTDVKGPLSKAQVAFTRAHHQIPAEAIESGEVAKWNTAWVMKGAKRLKEPVDYKHPSGAVIWVSLDEETQSRLARALSSPKDASPKKDKAASARPKLR